MHIAVCDDNRDVLAQLDHQLRLSPRVAAVRCFARLDDFLRSVEGGRQYDAILMDIDWFGCSEGIDAAEKLERLSPRTRVIYVTGYSGRFSQQIFLRRANLSGYLTKPVDQALLEANLEKVADSLILQEEPALVIRSRGSVLHIPFREIAFLEGRGHNVVIHTPQETFEIYERLESMQSSLPPDFFRCHKSFIVNMRHIRRFQQPDILLKCGALVPVSRARYAQVRDAYFRFMGQTF